MTRVSSTAFIHGHRWSVVCLKANVRSGCHPSRSYSVHAVWLYNATTRFTSDTASPVTCVRRSAGSRFGKSGVLA